MSFLDHIAHCNNANLAEFEPWFIGSLGRLPHRDFLPASRRAPTSSRTATAPGHLSAHDRSEALHQAPGEFLLAVRAHGWCKAWRDEDYPVTPYFTPPPLMAMERAAVPWFGVRDFGPHMTGYVRKPDGLHIWVPRRSYDKPTFPGQLDNTVAGGQPIGLGLHENLIKECAEEASIPRALAEQAKAVGIVAYWHQSGAELKPDIMSCFDLELPQVSPARQ
jgi:hypothetical protein